MMRPETTFLTHEAVFVMDCELSLTSASLITLWTCDSEGTGLKMLAEFGLAWEDALASDTLEMISLEMLIERS